MAVEGMAAAGRHGTIVVAETSKPCLKAGERANWEYYGLLKPPSLSASDTSYFARSHLLFFPKQYTNGVPNC